MKVIENYRRAIENSDANLFKEVFAPQISVEIPAGAIFDQRERSSLSIESGGQNRSWNKMHLSG